MFQPAVATLVFAQKKLPAARLTLPCAEDCGHSSIDIPEYSVVTESLEEFVTAEKIQNRVGH